MDANRRATLKWRLHNWSEMRDYLDDMGSRGGCDYEPSYRSEGESPSNRAAVATLSQNRRSGICDAADVATALSHAKAHAPYQIGLLIHQAIYAGTEKERLAHLAEIGVWLEPGAYKAHLTSALLLFDTELRRVGKRPVEKPSTEEICT